MLSPNDTIKIDFLNARPDLNGRLARLVEFLPDRARWHAIVLQTDEHVCIKPENCFEPDGTEPTERVRVKQKAHATARTHNPSETSSKRATPPNGQRLWCLVPQTHFHSPNVLEVTSKVPLTAEKKQAMYEGMIDMEEKEKREGDEHVYLQVPTEHFRKTAKNEVVTCGYFVLTKEMQSTIADVVRTKTPPGGGVYLILNLSSSTELEFKLGDKTGPETSLFKELGIDKGVEMIPTWNDNKNFRIPCTAWYIPKTQAVQE